MKMYLETKLRQSRDSQSVENGTHINASECILARQHQRPHLTDPHSQSYSIAYPLATQFLLHVQEQLPAMLTESRRYRRI